MPVVKYTQSAVRDVETIGAGLAVESPSAAEHFLSSLRLHCRQLARVESMGRDRNEFGDGVRSFLIGPVIVYYRRDAEGTTVLRVLRSTRQGG